MSWRRKHNRYGGHSARRFTPGEETSLPRDMRVAEDAKHMLNRINQLQGEVEKLFPVAVVVFVRNSQGQYIAGLRKDSERWGSPGGHLRKGESLEECAHREVMEETGLEIHGLRKFTFFIEDHPVTNKRYVVVVFLADALTDQFTMNEEEHSEMGWFDLEDPPSPLFGVFSQVREMLLEK